VIKFDVKCQLSIQKRKTMGIAKYAMTTALTSMFQYFFPHCTLSLTTPDLHNTSKKFVTTLCKPLLEKRIASHKKILYPRNIRVFHEKYIYKKARKKIFSFRRRIMRPFVFISIQSISYRITAQNS